MLAKVSIVPAGIMHELEQCPNSMLWLSENGRKSHDPDVRGRHNDGCGMAYINKSGELKYTRHGKEEFWSNYYRDFAMEASSKLFIVHNRFASEGLDTTSGGAHPFVIERAGRSFAFCHNGAIDSYMSEARDRKTSDSEILLEKLVGNNDELSAKVLADRLTTIAIETEYNSLSGFLLDKEQLFLWRIFNERRKEDIDRLNRYFTLYLSIRKNHLLIASEPLDDESWQLLPNNKMLTITPNDFEIKMQLIDLPINDNTYQV